MATSLKTLQPDVATFGVGLDGFSAHFEPIIDSFKASNPRNTRGDDFVGFLGWKHPRAWFFLGKKID